MDAIRNYIKKINHVLLNSCRGHTKLCPVWLLVAHTDNYSTGTSCCTSNHETT